MSSRHFVELQWESVKKALEGVGRQRGGLPVGLKGKDHLHVSATLNFPEKCIKCEQILTFAQLCAQAMYLYKRTRNLFFIKKTVMYSVYMYLYLSVCHQAGLSSKRPATLGVK